MTPKNQEDLYRKIGNAMKSIRNEKKMTLQEIEKNYQLNAATVSLVERGKQNYSLGWIIHYCNILEVDPTEVFLRAFKEDFQEQQLNKMYERFGPYNENEDK
ncbi:helix-turn-helix domain-containing protein [Planococcus sp. 1R117A]|uniref:helix-turn-helix domain-containing protein n=1 Tax=Planococcus sp. 1R117A TaxID=3447020 RepID=UPI003EDBB42B